MPLTVVIRRRSPRRNKRWRWLVFAIVILLAIVTSVPFWVPGLFRDDLVDLVSDRIDRPASIGKLAVRLLPKPALVAHDVQIGHPEFQVWADRVSLEINVASLRQRIVNITSINIDGLVWSIPDRPGDLAREIGAIKIRTGDGEKKWRGVIALAHAEDVRVVFAGQTDPVLTGNVELRDVLETTIGLTVDADAPIAGEAAKLQGAASFIKRPNGEPALAIEGTATLLDVDSRAFVDEDVVPNTQLDFESIKFVRTGAKSVSIQMNGESFPASSQAAEVEALTGAFEALAVWEEGRTGVHINQWRASGFEFTGDIDIDEDGAVTTSIDDGLANAAGIEAYFKLRPLAEYTVKPRADATLSAANIQIHRAAGGGLTLQGGTASFSGIDLLVENGAQAFTGFSGDVVLADNLIALNNIHGDGLTINGTIAPDFDAESYRFDLNGGAELSRDRISGFVSTDRIASAAGRIEIASLKGTTTRGGGLPDDFFIEGQLIGGRFQIESPDWSDTLEGVELVFDAEADRIATTVAAQSTMFGAVRANGTFLVPEDRWTGTVSGNFSDVDLPSLEGKTRDVAMNIFDELGQSELDVTVVAPQDDAEPMRIDVTRRGTAPAVVASVSFRRVEDAWTLDDVAVTANLSSAVLAPLTPDSVLAEGPMDVRFDRSAADRRFRADVDLNAAAVAFGDYVSKRSGAPLIVSIEGHANEEEWAADVIDATILTTSVRGTLDEERFNIATLDVDMASLAPLFREGGAASGRITGSIRTNPTDIVLTMDKVRIALSDDLVADHIDGRLHITDEGVQTEGLRVTGANSEFTLNLRETDGRWAGGIVGPQIDANTLMEFADAFDALGDSDAEPGALASIETVEPGQSLLAGEPEPLSEFEAPIQDDSKPIASRGLEGEFDVNVDTLLYRKATLTNVQTTLVASDGNYAAKNLSFIPNTGTTSGNIRYSRGEPPHGNRIIADLVFDGVDAKIIDELAFEEPRNLTGILTGTTFVDLPIGAEGVDLAGINGSLQVKGVDGTLGSLGFANAVLFVFKTTEILFLSSPFAENGLSYKELNGKATIENGRITLGVFEEGLYTEAITLERPSYRMSAIGWVDLGQWDSEVIVHMQPLSSVADAARIFKIDQVEAINSKGGIRIRMTGPPDDPKTEIAFGGPVNAITKEIRGGFRSVQGLVKDQIIEGIGGLVRGLLER